MGHIQDATEKYLRGENEKLCERLERQNFIIIDMLEKLEALEASCREMLSLDGEGLEKKEKKAHG